jgi:hypothetical protein
MNDIDNEMEAKIAELDRIEKLKRPQPFYPTEAPLSRAAQQTECDRLEALKRPTVLPPQVAPDFIAEQRERLQREARHERLKAAIGGRLR